MGVQGLGNQVKRKVYLCQVNHQYGRNVFLPFSVGLLQAYCQSQPDIAEAFDFAGFIYTRQDQDTLVPFLESPDVVGISSYIWNWAYSCALAQKLKQIHPSCLVVMGGPQVPVRSEGFFQENPSVDLLVHYEGEHAFAEILRESLKSIPDYTTIPGLSVQLESQKTFVTPPRARQVDLSQLPSPYLTGVFDHLMTGQYDFHASQETHRGCPYSCTFCDWGSSVFQKVRSFDDQRLIAEFDWFGRNKIELLYNCDANYGLLPRDQNLTEKMVETKQTYGFPKQFRAAYAKKSNDRVFNIAMMLNAAAMSKGVTLSFQSMDAETLAVIKRENIGISAFESLMHRYHAEQIPTYTELIMGLPGETYTSFTQGIDKLLQAGQHDSLSIYMCAVLPNSEMGDPEYRQLHGIQTVRMPILLSHRSATEVDIPEYNDVVVATNVLPHEDWKKTYLFAWAVQSFHCLALTQFVAMYLQSERGISYTKFYEALLHAAKLQPASVLGRQYELVVETMDRALAGGKWDIVLPEFGDVVWPTEEATFLNLVKQKERFYAELAWFLDELDPRLDPAVIRDLLNYQKQMIKTPGISGEIAIESYYNFHEFFQAIYTGQTVPLRFAPTTHKLQAEVPDDLIIYAQKIVWYGRKGGTIRHRVKELA